MALPPTVSQPPQVTATAKPTLRECFQRLSRSVWERAYSLAVLQFFLKLTSVLLFSWAIGALLGWLISWEGNPAIGNTALIGFAISPIGWASILLIPAAYLGTVYFEQACIVHVLADPAGRVLQSMLRAASRLPQIMQLATIQIALMMAMAAPLVLMAGITYRLLLADADINFYLTQRPPKFYLAVGIGVLLLAILGCLQLLLVFRWFVSLPWLLLGNVNAVEALRYSSRAREARPFVWRSMLVWLAVRVLCWIVGVLSIGCLTYVCFEWMDHYQSTSVVLTTGLLVIHSVIASGLTAIDQCWHVAGKWQAYLCNGARIDANQSLDLRATLSRKRAVALGVTVLLTVLVLGMASFQQALTLADQHDVQIVAHRAGAIRAPENSLSALRLAIEEGADAAEIDVQLSRDGTIFVVHDRDLMRLAAVPLEVSKATDAELRAVQIPWKRSSQAQMEKLATLEEFLDIARDKIRLSIELKYYGWNNQLAIQVLELLRAKDMLDQCEVISLEYRALEQVADLEPKLPRGFLVSTSLGDITKLKVQLLSVSQAAFSDALLSKANARNMQVAVWTIDDPETMFQLMVRGADQIVTNDPAAAVAVAEQYAQLSDVELFLVRLRERLSN